MVTPRLLLAGLMVGALLFTPTARAGEDAPAVRAEDLWVTTERACVAGDRDNALARLRAVEAPDVDALRRYAQRRSAESNDKDRLASFDEALARREQGDRITALSLATSARGASVDVIGILAAELAAESSVEAGSPPESWLRAAQAYSDVARAAETIGWRTRAAELYGAGVAAATNARNFRLVSDLADRAFILWSALGDEDAAALELLNAGSAAAEMRDAYRALDAFRRVRESAERRGDPLLAAIALGNAGVVYADVGFYSRALNSFDRALLAARKAGAAGAGEEAATLDRIGTTRTDIGQPTEAILFHEQARARYLESSASAKRSGDEETESRSRAGAAMALGNRGIARSALSEFETARKDLEDALREFERLGSSHEIATAMLQLADLFGKMGDLRNGLTYQQGAASRWKELQDDRSVTAAEGVAGDIRFAKERYSEAISTWTTASEKATRIDAADLVVEYDAKIAKALLRMKDFGGSLEAARRARRRLADLILGLGDQEAATARDIRADIFETGVAAAAAKDDVAALFEFIEAGRAGTLLDAIGSRDALQFAVLPRDLAEQEQAARAAMSAARGSVSAAAVAGVGFKEQQPLRQAVTEAENTLAALQDRIRREAKTAAAVAYPEPITIAGLGPKHGLSASEALVSFVVDRAELAAVVVTSDGVAIRRLGRLEDAVASVRKFSFTRGGSVWKEPAAELAAQIWTPLGLTKAVTRVYVSPDGPLCYVPLHLVDVEREIVLVPSGSVWHQLRDDESRGPRTHRADVSVLALGAVDHSQPRPAGSLDLYGRSRRLTDLLSSGPEATAVGTRVLLGMKASEGDLRAALRVPPSPGTSARREPRWGALHIACHGLIDAERPLLTTLVLTPTGEDDGFLTVGEILNLRVSTDLVVLSACQSGIARTYRADGMLGFVHAFMAAGTPRAIVSLWNVDDEATKEFMIHFYREWRAGTATALALRSAREAIAARNERWKDPFYWAPWVLWGLPD